MADLRDQIARAMQHSDAWMGCDDEGWTCPGKECRYCWEVAQGCADAVIATLGMREEWMVHWPTYCVVYTFESRAELDASTDRRGHRLVDDAAIIERRYITDWGEALA